MQKINDASKYSEGIDNNINNVIHHNIDEETFFLTTLPHMLRFVVMTYVLMGSLNLRQFSDAHKVVMCIIYLYFVDVSKCIHIYNSYSEEHILWYMFLYITLNIIFFQVLFKTTLICYEIKFMCNFIFWGIKDMFMLYFSHGLYTIYGPRSLKLTIVLLSMITSDVVIFYIYFSVYRYSITFWLYMVDIVYMMLVFSINICITENSMKYIGI